MNEITNLKAVDTLPHSVEAEQQILGAIILGHPTTTAQSAGGADLFYDPVHAEIYRVCRRLEKADKPVTPVTVVASQSDDMSEGLAELGGNRYIARLASVAIAPGLSDSYVEILADAKGRRDLIALIDDARATLSKGDMTASDAAARIEAGLQPISFGPSSVAPVSMMKAATEALDDVFRAYQGEESAILRPGIGALEQIVPGLAAGEMWLLGGRPSMGKTAVGLSLGLNAARAGHSVIIASLEMTPAALAMRALSEATNRTTAAAAPYSDMRQGTLSEDQARNLHHVSREVAELPIMFLPREYQDADLMQVGVKQALRRMPTDKLPLVIVDYAQLMRSKARTRYEQITEISLALKGLAMSLNLPLIALSQLSRALEQRDDKRPIMSDLRESGQLEQDADGVMFCYRDEYYLERERPDEADQDSMGTWQAAMERAQNRLEIIVAKQRQGRVGTAHVRMNPATNHIWEDHHDG